MWQISKYKGFSGILINLKFFKQTWGFHPIFVTSFLVVFGDEVTKVLRNSLFTFFYWARQDGQNGNLRKKQIRNRNDKKTKNKVTKICNEPGIIHLSKLRFWMIQLSIEKKLLFGRIQTNKSEKVYVILKFFDKTLVVCLMQPFRTIRSKRVNKETELLYKEWLNVQYF